MNITAVTGLRWADAEQTVIDCHVTIGGSSHPFTASLEDPDEHGQKIFFQAALGSFGPIGSYVAPPAPPLEALKAAKWEEVKAERDRRENGSAPTPFGLAQCDDRSKLKINGLVTMAEIAAKNGLPFQKGFTLTDNSVVICDADMMVALGFAVGNHVDAIHATARDLRAAIEACSSAEQLAAIDIPAAPWP